MFSSTQKQPSTDALAPKLHCRCSTLAVLLHDFQKSIKKLSGSFGLQEITWFPISDPCHKQRFYSYGRDN